MFIRRYRPGEETKLLEVYKSSIRENAKKYYTKKQLMAWAPDDINLELWKKRIMGINPYVIEESGNIVGYADLQSNGYIDHFFIKGGCSGKGYGKTLMTYLLQHAEEKNIENVTSDVSLAAQGLFKKFNFEIVKRKFANIDGVSLENALMKKELCYD